MAFSFDETLPTDKDVVRSALGDTDAAAVLRSDEAILATLSRFAALGSPLDATIGFIASSLANEYRRKPSSFSESGGVSLSWADRVKGWDGLARDLRAGKIGFDVGSIGGASWAAPVDLTTDLLEPQLAEVG